MDDKLSADMMDAFIAKWGFGDVPLAYRGAYEADLGTVKWVDGLALQEIGRKALRASPTHTSRQATNPRTEPR